MQMQSACRHAIDRVQEGDALPSPLPVAGAAAGWGASAEPLSLAGSCSRCALISSICSCFSLPPELPGVLTLQQASWHSRPALLGAAMPSGSTGSSQLCPTGRHSTVTLPMPILPCPLAFGPLSTKSLQLQYAFRLHPLLSTSF